MCSGYCHESTDKGEKVRLSITAVFGNFRENFIFANSFKRHISDVRNL